MDANEGIFLCARNVWSFEHQHELCDNAASNESLVRKITE